MRRLLCLLLVALLFALVGCQARPFDAGEPLSREEVAALKAELLEKAAAEGATEEEEKREEAPPEWDGLYRWLSGGGVYHKHVSCAYIKDREDILEGALEAALAAGKEKPCSRCAAE